MSGPFRVALTGDFRKADGSPVYPDFDLEPLGKAPNVEFAYLEPRNPVEAEQLKDFDALILLAHRFTKDSIHPNGRLAVVARFGVGYDTVDVEACTRAGIALVITPDGVRRPVAVSIVTFILALSGKLIAKDRLTREAAAGFAQARRIYGRRPCRAHARIDRDRQYRRRAFPLDQALRHEADRARSLRRPEARR